MRIDRGLPVAVITIGAALAGMGCSGDEGSVAAPSPAAADDSAVATRILSLDPAEAQEELGGYVLDSGLEQGTRLLGLRRLESGGEATADKLVEVGSTILANTSPTDRDVGQLRVNVVAALARLDENGAARAEVDRQLAAEDAAWRTVVASVVTDAQR